MSNMFAKFAQNILNTSDSNTFTRLFLYLSIVTLTLASDLENKEDLSFHNGLCVMFDLKKLNRLISIIFSRRFLYMPIETLA